MKSLLTLTLPALFALAACSSSSTDSGFSAGAEAGGGGSSGDGGTGGGGGDPDGGGTGTFNSDGGGASDALPDGSVVVTTTIYANTDDTLYSMDPKTKAVTRVGKFVGMAADGGSTTVTDVAVDASGAVYVNTSSAVYKATLPSSPGGTVQLTKVASIALKASQSFYALAFAPAGVLGAGEMLVGGDGAGELWSIDVAGGGTTKDLGSFGPVLGSAGSVFGLSGDIVFYSDAAGQPTGLATIRSCKGTTCTKTNDYLAGIDMAALSAAFTSGTPAPSLLKGIYGGSATSVGNGTKHGELFGLGAWEGSVYAFARAQPGTPAVPPALLSIDPATGLGTEVPATFDFTTGGWSGAGVTTKVTITVPPPPPPPR